MYKQASQLSLKFQTTVGSLSVDQLWGLNLTQLTTAVKAAKKVLKGVDNDDDLSFLESTKAIDVEAQLRFDILKDVYLTKKKAQDEVRAAADVKAHNQKILALIAEKKDDSLKGMSIEELEKQLQ